MNCVHLTFALLIPAAIIYYGVRHVAPQHGWLVAAIFIIACLGIYYSALVVISNHPGRRHPAFPCCKCGKSEYRPVAETERLHCEWICKCGRGYRLIGDSFRLCTDRGHILYAEWDNNSKTWKIVDGDSEH